MNITQTPEADPADARQAAVLEAAVGVFARYGYRKTSMDEVARAAGVSRQGLYLQFASDAWSGRFIGSLGSDAADLMCASTSLAGATLAHYETQFELAVARAIADSPLNGFCATAGLSPADLARALHATARGFKQRSASREEFIKGMTVAARMFCAPLSQCEGRMPKQTPEGRPKGEGQDGPSQSR